MKNILFVGAHHDDLEMAIGGSVPKWMSEGKKVSGAILTTSEWTTPQGTVQRSFENVIKECETASKILGYKPYHLKVCRDFELRYDDSVVRQILNLIDQESIDTLITIWPYDAHPTHQIASQIALSSTRKVPNVLTSKISWNSVREAYKPTFFIDISQTIEKKLEALKCYKDEYERVGNKWEKYIRSSGGLYGLEANCDYAEAFEVIKLRS